MGKGLNNCFHLSVDKWRKNQHVFVFPQNKFQHVKG